MNNQKIGNFIKLLRKEKGLSQNELSEILHITRQAISNWETGKSAPDSELLIDLSDFFHVPINAILLGEKDITKEKIEKVTIDLLNDNKKKSSKLKRQLIIFISVILMLVFSFLAYYFISTYNSIKVYRIGAQTKKFFIQDGLIIHTKNKTYIKIGYVENINEKDEINLLKLYLKDINGKKKLIHTTNNPGADVIEILEGKDVNINDLRNKIFIEVTYNETEVETIKIEFIELFKSNLNYYKIEKNKTIKPVLNEQNDIQTDETNDNQSLESVNQEVKFEIEQKLEVPVPEASNNEVPEDVPEEKKSIDFNQIINILKEKETDESGVKKIEFLNGNQIISTRLENDRIYIESLENDIYLSFTILINNQDMYYYEKNVNDNLIESRYINISENTNETEELEKILSLIIKNNS